MPSALRLSGSHLRQLMCLQESIPTPAEWQEIGDFPQKESMLLGRVPVHVPLLSMTQPTFPQDVQNLTGPPHLPPHGVQFRSGKFQSYQSISLAEPRLGLHGC